VEFRILGPVEVHDGGQRIDIGHAQRRAVLAVLLLDLARVVTADQLIGRVWGSDAPPSVRNALHGHVARLRAALAAVPGQEARLVLRGGGYVLTAGPEQVDVFEFRRLVAVAASVDGDDAEALLRAALACWRGSALAGVASPWLDGMRDALELERRAAVLDLNDIGLRRGRHDALLPELAELAEANREDERLAGQLMLALYRSGRTADALRRYEQTRRLLADELGADPGPGLQDLHQKILRGDRSLDSPRPDGRHRAVTADTAPAALAERPAEAGVVAAGPVADPVRGWPVPRELPPDVPAFTGRAAEMAELERLLGGLPRRAEPEAVQARGDDPPGSRSPEPDDAEFSAPPAVVVSAVAGTAGVGKTALAVRWARRAAARFPDGQLYVNLRGYDPGQPMAPADALAGFLSSLGVAGEDIPAELDARAARYRSLVAGRRVLVLLDNASDAEQVRPLLPGAAACRVVVTSRDALAGLVARDGARRLELDLLPMADAVALLRTVIGARVDTEPEAARTLAGRCARLPLALRVAAELAVAQPALPLAQLAAELADEQGRLDLLDVGGDPRTAVRTVFSWSCRHLDQATVQEFGLLGLHPGPDMEPYAAAAVAGVTLPEARRMLAALARAHLIQPSPSGPGRYAIHDLLRAYARDLAAVGGTMRQQAAVTRLMDHYLSTAAAATSVLYPAERQSLPAIPAAAEPAVPVTEPDAARAWLDAQLACLTSAVGHAAAHGWPTHAIDLARTLSRYLGIGSHFAVATTIHSHAVSAARQLGDRAAEATALVALGGIPMNQERFEEAAAYLRPALALAREAGDKAAEVRALGNLANIDLVQGRYQEAASHFARALVLGRETGNEVDQVRALVSLGVISMLRSCHYQAIGQLRQALAIVVRTGDRLGEADTLSELGRCEIALGSYRQAGRHLGRSLALARELRYQSGEAYALGGLGKVQLRRGRYRRAAELLRQAIALNRELGDRAGEAEMLNHLGEVLFADGQPEQARSQHAAALGLASETGDQYEQARAHSGLAACCHAAGDDDQARRRWKDALAIFTRIGSGEADQVRARLATLGAEAGTVHE
jgi:DNA-binding SARP family transcriptional activator/Flp pilus assembly protein TadD